MVNKDIYRSWNRLIQMHDLVSEHQSAYLGIILFSFASSNQLIPFFKEKIELLMSPYKKDEREEVNCIDLLSVGKATEVMDEDAFCRAMYQIGYLIEYDRMYDAYDYI